MKYDDVIEATGAFGRFQCFTFILMGMFPLWTYHTVASPFIVMEVDHWCHVSSLNNFTKDEQRYIAIPYDEEGHYAKCIRYGRKTVSMLSNAVTITGGMLCVFAPNYLIFGLGRIIVGAGRLSMFAVGIIYILEVTGKTYRGYVGLGYLIMFGTGYCIMAWVAKACKNDIHLQLVMTLPTILYFTYWWILPESPRWLVVNKHYDAAHKAIHHIAKINRRMLDSTFNVLDIHVENGMSKHSQNMANIIRVFKGPTLRRRILVIFYVWFTIVLQYYAVSFNVATLPGDIYLATFYLGFMELIGPALGMAIINRPKMGRRLTLVFTLVGTGIAGFVCLPLLCYGYNDVLLTAVLFGRLHLTISFGIAYFYTPELFPTEVRNSALGAASTMGRVSGMMVAFIGGPLANVWWALPNVIYGVMGTTAGLLCLLLPETLGQRMCETIDEAEGRTNMTSSEENVTENSKILKKETESDKEYSK